MVKTRIPTSYSGSWGSLFEVCVPVQYIYEPAYSQESAVLTIYGSEEQVKGISLRK